MRHGETGLLVANDAEAWYRALRQLVDDLDLRKQIQRQARVEIEKHYSQEIFEAVFLRQIEQLAGSAGPRRRPSRFIRRVPGMGLAICSSAGAGRAPCPMVATANRRPSSD